MGLPACLGILRLVMRYGAEALHGEFGGRFRIERSSEELHRTPWGTAQQFVYCCCRVE
jgi:hypothetical protein